VDGSAFERRRKLAAERLDTALRFLHASSDAPRARRRQLIVSTGAVCLAMLIIALVAAGFAEVKIRAADQNAAQMKTKSEVMESRAKAMTAEAAAMFSAANRARHIAGTLSITAQKAQSKAERATAAAAAAIALAQRRKLEAEAAGRKEVAERITADRKMNGVLGVEAYNSGLLDYKESRYSAAIGDFSKAVPRFELAATTSTTVADRRARLSDAADAYDSRGRARIMAGLFPSALGDFNRAIILYRRFGSQASLANSYNARGVVFRHLLKYQQAIADYTASIALYTRAGAAASSEYFNRGLLKVRLRDDAGAATDFSMAIKQYVTKQDSAGEARAYYERGNVYYRGAKVDLALADYNAAVKLDYTLADAFRARGKVYYDRGVQLEASNATSAASAYDLSAADFSRALEIEPHDSATQAMMDAAQRKRRALVQAPDPSPSP
jgi:tetratricopeptide (TPR) repeat protein